VTQRQHDARMNLRRAVAIFGPEADDTRIAAIQFCHARNIDPHFRYAAWPKLTGKPTNEPMIEPAAVGSIAEWQRVVAEFVAERRDTQ